MDAPSTPDAQPDVATPDAQPDDIQDPDDPPTGDWDGELGAVLGAQSLDFALFSLHATRVEVWIYDVPTGSSEVLRAELERDADAPVWTASVPLDQLSQAVGDGTVYYGYRLWGPNWPFDPEWAPGNTAGFVSDVDDRGNRFNPNKLVLDPYAPEMSHDPWTPQHNDGRPYATGEFRAQDSASIAPKGIVLALPQQDRPAAPTRAFKDEIVYEVHVRGLTKADPSVPEEWRGTYRGAAEKAAYLKDLGITAVEFLPLHETQNARNDVEEGTPGDNYWGYSSLSYFAPDRRYAADQSPGGPTRELMAMVDAFHAEGIKVYVDVVYNHTGEGGVWDESGVTAPLLSWRGIDNRAYYQLAGDVRHYHNNNGVSANVDVTEPFTRRMIIDSLRYWHEVIGVDGFRFDLASILGNDCQGACFSYNRDKSDGVLVQAATALPARPAEGGPGVDLIAEPWAIGPGTYQVGNFPGGWGEWNDQYRNTMRDAQNRLGFADTTPAKLTTRIHGSSDLFRDDGRQPWHSVNFIVAHDGLTLHDLYSCNDRNNNQPWPFGPSDGGTDDNRSWDQGGDPAAQRQAARTGLALLMLSSGVPMITGGDEMLRTQRCNNNTYNLDSPGNWLDWSLLETQGAFYRYARALMAFRHSQSALRPGTWTEGVDRDGDGVLDVAWLGLDGAPMSAGALTQPENRFLAWRLDGDEQGPGDASIYVGYNRSADTVRAILPEPRQGRRWLRVLDTSAWMEPLDNHHPAGQEDPLPDNLYDFSPRSLIVYIER